MEPPASKRRRLAELAGVKYVTGSALAAVFAKLHNLEDDVELTGKARRTISDTVKADASVPTIYESLLTRIAIWDSGVYVLWPNFRRV